LAITPRAFGFEMMKHNLSKDPTYWVVTHSSLGWTIASDGFEVSFFITEKQALWAIKASQRARNVYNHFTAKGGKWGLALV